MFIEPVFGKKFFGREEVLGTLQKRVTALKGGYRQNLALTGPMLVGKSSILRHFLKDIQDTDIIPLYIEMGDIDFTMFLTRFMATLIYQYLRSIQEDTEGDFEDLKKRCYRYIPQTMHDIDQVCRLVDKKKNNAAYEKLLGLSSTFKMETGKSCIVILDEFHNLAQYRLKKPFQVFGKFIMVQKNTMYVVSSSQKTLLKEILAHKLALLFGNFEVINIEGFDNQTAKYFMTDKIKGEIPCENVKNYLIEVSHGNPFYLEALAGKFSELVKRNPGITKYKEHMLNAFAELLYESDGILNQYFTNNINFFLEKRSRKKFIPLLISLAKGNSTIKAIQKDLGKNDQDLGKKLQKLQDMDLVYSSGMFYKIEDKLFEYWLKYVHCLKTSSIVDDMDIKYLEFKQALGADYGQFCGFLEMDATSVVKDLFRKFRNEKIKINIKCRKMPHFDKVDSRRYSSTIEEITGKIKNKKWICHLKKGARATEQDISDLWSIKSPKTGSKIVRKVFIALDGIEHNAFLLAKEQNIWVWDIKQLNDILRLFLKFELVI